ncbi:monovalent cation:proton antiporter-2 (CPA2) family protein [Terrihabitans rhizophilus]|uniref:Monovalent cation:proton antiporter-2 (CPA2) family protein n=1 Tax=Terrihabitans rhizophilus TaxID=3092662 RepID=A0ABU4RJI2_9HYPH|nr:monovalent cation:proton antiporter-2 (CPA2) family protein [Terrihabitans sp. PJ23]MDX6804996.1 monovalent cation:proton antiporter-2 (CPA2) family protein [Terrihabitans sp. PJ23]
MEVQMAVEGSGPEIGQAVALLAAGVIAVPLFRRLGLGSVLGYLAAGVVIGPFGFAVLGDPESALHIAELGVVLFLFVIGLEMRPGKLWAMRGQIFGLGLAQVLTCGAVLSGASVLAGVPPIPALIGSLGFVLSSTAVIMQMLEERGQTVGASGERAIAILLLEDIAIVPLLALVAFLGSLQAGAGEAHGSGWQAVLIGLGCIAAVVVVGHWLLDPFFRVLARAGAREVMTAAALLVVLGVALFMQWGGLSMAMGAFLAGVLLSESSFRHQLEADIEPFRGLLLGLFFLSVGMSLDLAEVAADWPIILGGVLGLMALKAVVTFAIARLFGAGNREAVQRSAIFAQGGEFAFVLYAAALATGLFDARISAIFTAMVILSMALTPVVVMLVERFLPQPTASMDGVEEADGLQGRVLIIGFGRFAQIVSQPLLARGVEVSLIETDVDLIRVAATFGFKIYYGDGTRLDVLRTSGAADAEAILICTDKAETNDRIVELCHAEFPLARLFVRAYDRGHAVRLANAGVAYQMRETFESAMTFGHDVLIGLGVDVEDAAEVMADVRRRDAERLELQITTGIDPAAALMRGNVLTTRPEPLTKPRHVTSIPPEAAEVPEPAKA